MVLNAVEILESPFPIADNMYNFMEEVAGKLCRSIPFKSRQLHNAFLDVSTRARSIDNSGCLHAAAHDDADADADADDDNAQHRQQHQHQHHHPDVGLVGCLPNIRTAHGTRKTVIG